MFELGILSLVVHRNDLVGLSDSLPQAGIVIYRPFVLGVIDLSSVVDIDLGHLLATTGLFASHFE